MEHWGFYLRGRALELLGLRPQAIEAYRQAMRSRPDFLRPPNRIAYLLSLDERYAEAEPYFQAVLHADPGNAAAHFNLGFTYDKRGLLEQAVAQFREATRLNASLDRAWYGLGMALARLGRHEEAAAALHEAATLQPMNPHAWYHLGMAHHTIGNAERVKEVAHHLVRFDPRVARQLIRDAKREDLFYLVKDLLV